MPKYRAPFDTPIIATEQRDAYALADKHTPKMVRAIRRGLRHAGDTMETVVRNALTAYYYAPAAATAVNAAPEMRQAWAEVERLIAASMLTLWQEAEDDTRQVVKSAAVAVSDELARNPALADAAAEFAQMRAAAMVTAISEQTRAAIMSLIAEGVELGLHPRIVARRVKELGLGLAEKGPHTYERVRRYKEAQEEAGVTGKKLEGRVKRFHAKMVRERSESIARTEMIGTQAAARQNVWNQERATGLIPVGAVRVWIAGHGERTCPHCAAMDGSTAPLGEPYENGVMSPPLHPRCRCVEAVRLP